VTLRAWTVALLLAGRVAAAQVPVTVRLEDAGTGPGPTLLIRALAGPHLVIEPGTTQAVLTRDRVYRETVIILGRDAAVDGTVHGDVIVVGGNLHLHPGSVVTGRAVAYGGGVYESALSTSASTMAFRDFTYDVVPLPSGGYAVRYRSFFDRPATAVAWPDIFGVRFPTYDRTNGVSLTAGPVVAPPRTTLIIEPTVSYRSELGVVDPGLAASVDISSRTTVQARMERGTFSNEDWIWPDYLNSAATLLAGHDVRNHFRATRGEASVSRRWRWESSEIEPFFGARLERDESVRPDSNAQAGPWSFSGRRERDDMLRPNPPIDDGSIFSGLAGIRMQWFPEAFSALLRVDVEGGGFTHRGNDSTTSPSFVQTTLNGVIQFPTFKTQSLRLETHAVISFADSTPRQRWAYVGGSGSITTLELLERGGDQLFYFDGRYNIPLERIQLPFLGPPVFTIREILAGADVGGFPSLAQAIGTRLSAGAVYIEYLVDPAGRRGHFGGGLSVSR
jgi:hypothetical protein